MILDRGIYNETKKEEKNNKKLFLILGIGFSLLVILIAVIVWYQKEEEKNRLTVILKNDLEVEINSEVYLLSFVERVVNGSIVTDDMLIDTSKLGNKKLVVSVKDTSGKIIDYKFEIVIVDTIKPEIEAQDEVTIYVGDNISLMDDVKVSDNSLEDILVEVSGGYDVNKVGKYELKYVAKDSSGNIGEYDFILNVVNDPNNRVFTTSKGYSGKVIDGVTYIDGILIVNKTYGLPSNYGNGLTIETMNAFNKMKNDASYLGLNLYISSGYRSYYDQRYIYNNYVKRDGKTAADRYSARAGYSEHQTGLAFDLNTINASFANTAEGIWVSNNCYKYGLILRYPEGKEEITGYMYESWHLRYVGVTLATKLYNDGNWITLEEYFGIDSKYSQ